MKRFALTAGLALALWAPALPGKAGGIPVIDTAAIGQMIQDFQQELKDYAKQIEQLQALREQIANQIKQINELRAQVEAVTGSRAISALLNGDLERAARLTLDRQVNGLIREVGAGNIAVMTEGQLSVTIDPEAIATEMLDNLGLSLEQLEALSRSEEMHDRGTAAQAGSGVVLSVIAQDAHARAGEAVGRFEKLIAAIDAQADIKGSTDLNTRVTAELGFMLVDMIRLEATKASALGTQAIIAARDREAQSKTLVYDRPRGDQ